jgi:hypothetical protein
MAPVVVGWSSGRSRPDQRERDDEKGRTMDQVFTIHPTVALARPHVWSPLASSFCWEMYTDHGINGTATGTTGSKRLTPGHLTGALT